MIFSKFDISTVDFKNIDITWELAPTTKDLSQYHFTLIRSLSEDFSLTNSGITEITLSVNEFTYTDYLYNLYKEDKLFDFWYRIDLRHNTNPKEIYSSDIKKLHYSDYDWIAKEISRWHNVVLKKVNRHFVLFYKMRKGGEYCSCYDTTLNNVTENCPICFGTGWKYGYFNPLKVYCLEAPTQVSKNISMLGEMQRANSSIVLGYKPEININDVVVTTDKRIHKVGNVSIMSRNGRLVTQRVMLEEVSHGHILYNLTLPQNFNDVKEL